MNYDQNFRNEAVRLSNEIGVSAAAKKLNIPYYTLAEWRKARSRHLSDCETESDVSNLTIDELRRLVKKQQKDIEELKKSNQETEQANEILKDALGFFAKDRKKK